MTAELDVIQPSGRKKRGSKFPADVLEARLKEQTRRAVLARSRALTILGKRYPEEFEELRKQERAIIDLSSGPVPGDSSE